MNTWHRVLARLRHYRTLLVIILITALVWMVWAMSDTQTYPAQVRVDMRGIDTARYAVVKADTVLSVEVVSDGFSAMRRHFKIKRNDIVVDMTHAEGTPLKKSVSVLNVIPILKEQLGLPSALRVTSGQDSLRLRLAERKAKAFVPELRDVSIEFTDQCGLYGEPEIIPDTIWLYGSEASLSKIDAIYTKPAQVKGINKNDTVALELEPVWKKYEDLRVSSTMVGLKIPTQNFTEKSFDVPVQVSNLDTTITVKLYPEQVKVTMWVPMKDFTKTSAEHFDAKVVLRENEDKAQVMIKNFPSSMRVKQIEPEYVQYVIIK